MDEDNAQKDNGQETIESGGPQPVYGVSIFMLEDGNTVVHLTGNPSMAQLYALVAEKQNAFFINMVATTVVGMMRAEAAKDEAKRKQIVIPKLEVHGGKLGSH